MTGILAACGPARAVNLTVDTSNGNTPFTVSASSTYDLIYVGYTGTGTLILNNAAVTLTASSVGFNFMIGNGVGSTGFVTLSAGTINANSVAVGTAPNTTGTVNQTGGTFNAQIISIAAGTSSTGTWNISGGSMITSGSGLAVGIGGTGTLNISGTASVSTGTSGTVSIGNGTVNLDGGTLTTRQISAPGGSPVLRFNGGTLQAAANQTAFLTGLTRAEVRNGGAIIDSNGFDITIGQALIHSTVGGDAATDGGLTKNGAGNLTLTGALSYTGLTTIAGGSLELGDATRSVTLPGNATLTGGTLAVANGSLGTGTITNNLGQAVVIGSLNGATATAGSATINSNGTVAFQNSGSAGTAVITSSGLVDFANNSTAGNAQIVNNGTGILQFRDNSTAANATITTNSGAPGGTPDGTGTVFAGSSSGGTSRQIVNAGGMLDISFVTGAGVTIGSLEGAGVVGLGNKTLTVGANNLSTSFSGIIQNTTFLVGAGTGGLTKIGTGTLTLGGTSTYAGPTNVNAGTLAVNGDISSSVVTVNTGGTLGGTGTVGATMIASGGTLSPGNSIGTLTVNGNLTFAAGARYAVEVSPASADRVNVTGTATLAGSVQTSFAAGAYINKRYTIVSANGGVLGTFGTLQNINLPANFTSALAYDANNAYLDLTLAFPFGAGLNINQQQVANALVNSFNAAGGIPAAFAGLNANGLSLVSGETGAALQQSLFTSADLFMRSVFDNALADGGTAGDCNDGAASARGALRGRPQDACAALPASAVAQPTWSVWATGYGGSLRAGGDAATGSHETTSRAAGAAAGATYDVSPVSRVGFALGGAGASYALAQGFGSGRSDDFNAALFGRHDFGRGYVAAALGYLWQQASTDRSVGADRLTASLHPQALTTRFEAGWRERTLPFGLAPYAAVQTIGMWLPSYAESGGQFALAYGSRQVTAARSELGVRLADSMFIGGKPLTLSGRVAWVHGWNTDWQTNAAIRQLVSSNFTVAGAALPGDSALLSLGASLGLGRGWTVATTFDGEFWRNAESYTGRAIVQYQW